MYTKVLLDVWIVYLDPIIPKPETFLLQAEVLPEVYRKITPDWASCISPDPLHTAMTCCLLQSFRSVILQDFEMPLPLSLSDLFLPTVCFLYSKENYNFHVS